MANTEDFIKDLEKKLSPSYKKKISKYENRLYIELDNHVYWVSFEEFFKPNYLQILILRKPDKKFGHWFIIKEHVLVEDFLSNPSEYLNLNDFNISEYTSPNDTTPLNLYKTIEEIKD